MTVHKQLVDIRDASIVTHRDSPPDMLSKHTEDALKLETLGQLAQSANQDIKAASVRILVERVLQDGAPWRLMLSDISGSNAVRRNRALTCLRFVLPSSRNDDKTEAVICSLGTFTAVIDCLCRLIPDACTAERGSASESNYRSQAERDALIVLDWILPCNSEKAIEAGLVSRWLVNYPFGGAEAPLSRKRDVLIETSGGKSRYDDDDFGDAMQAVLERAFRYDVLRKEMIEAGLIVSDDTLCRRACGCGEGNQTEAWNRIPEDAIRIHGGWSTGSQEIPDDPLAAEDWFRNVPEGAVRRDDGYSVHAGNRRREESIEERALRRRRREAVVVGRNGQPIEHEDIIQRTTVVEEEQIIEEQVEQLMDEVAEAQSRGQQGWLGWLRRLRPDGLAPVPSCGHRVAT